MVVLVQVDPVAGEEAEAAVKPQWSSMAVPSPSQQPQSQPQRLQHLPQLKEAKVKEAKAAPDKETKDKEAEADKTVKTTNKMISKTPSAT
jgi:hypothetical protein